MQSLKITVSTARDVYKRQLKHHTHFSAVEVYIYISVVNINAVKNDFSVCRLFKQVKACLLYTSRCV